MQRCTKALLLPAQFTAAGLDELIFVFLGAAQGGVWHPLNLNRLRGLSDRKSTGSVKPTFSPDVYLHSLLSFFVFLSVSLEVTVTSLHPPRLCRIAVFSIKPTFSLHRPNIN